MTKLLLNLFVPDHREKEDARVRSAIGALSGGVGIGANLLLFAAKLLAGLLTGSVSITADAMNNLSDASGSIMTLVGFRLAGETFHRFSVQLYQTPVRPLEGKFLLMVGNSVMQENGRVSIQGYLRSCRSSEQRFLAIEDGRFQRGVILKVGGEEADAESEFVPP